MPDTSGQQVKLDQPAGGTAGYGPDPATQPPAAPAAQRSTGGILVDPQILGAVIAQAATIFAVAIGIVYAAGALSLVFKLWYDGVPSLPVLVQLPRTWSISQAITELLPIAVAAGVLAVWTWNRLSKFRIARLIAGPADSGLAKAGPSKTGPANSGPPSAESDSARRKLSAWRWGAAVVLALVLACIAVVLARYVWIGPIPAAGQDQSRGGVDPRPWWNILILCLVLDTICIRLALHFASTSPQKSRLLKRIPRDLFRVAVVALAVIPIVASTSESFAFPLVKLCGPAFYNPGAAGRRFAFGNLIGVSGQYVYVAEILTKQPEPGHYVFAAGYIAVIPQSEAQLMAIGRNASCGQLAVQNAPG
jgi:hypothetical protein